MIPSCTSLYKSEHAVCQIYIFNLVHWLSLHQTLSIQKYSVEGNLHTTIQKTRSLVITHTFTESTDNLIKV